MHLNPSRGDTHQVLGTTATILVSGDDTGGRLAVIEHTVPLDAGPPPHVHQREDELFRILSGTFEFVLGDPAVWHPGGAGLWIHVPAGTIHTSHATTDGSRLLSIYSPAGGEAFFRDIDAIDQSDRDAVLALAARHGMTFPSANTR